MGDCDGQAVTMLVMVLMGWSEQAVCETNMEVVEICVMVVVLRAVVADIDVSVASAVLVVIEEDLATWAVAALSNEVEIEGRIVVAHLVSVTVVVRVSGVVVLPRSCSETSLPLNTMCGSNRSPSIPSHLTPPPHADPTGIEKIVLCNATAVYVTTIQTKQMMANTRAA
jgi:hypothetical protein